MTFRKRKRPRSRTGRTLQEGVSAGERPPCLTAVGLGVFGMALGYVLSRRLAQDRNRARTIALETGIQNGPLGILIVTLTFQGTLQQEVLLVPALYSLFIVLSSSAVTIWFRALASREELARDRAKVPVALVAARA